MGFKVRLKYDPDFPSATNLFVVGKDEKECEYYQESHVGMKLFYLESWFKNYDRKIFNQICGLKEETIYVRTY